MASLYIVELTSKMYPNLKPTAPEDPQGYRLQKLTKIEAFFLDEIEIHEQLAKKMKRFCTITMIVDTHLIVSTVISRRISITTFASLVELVYLLT